ncbi:MAG TPA: S8 family serine peptidase [Actinomycetota bacterium]
MAVALGITIVMSLVSGAGAQPKSRGAADSDGDKIFDDLERRLGASDARHDVVVLFSGGTSAAKAADARRAVGSFTTGYEYETMPAFAGSLTSGQIRALAARGDVVQVQGDDEVEFQMDDARAATGVDKARADFGPDGNNENSLTCPGARQYCGDDVVAAIIDSGVDKWHVDLDGGKVLGGADCSVPPCNPNGLWHLDTNGHGTHVASIFAGEGDGNAAMRGVAPGAAVVSLKVGSSGSTVSAVDAALEWVLANKDVYGIDIANMSLSGKVSSDGTDSTSRLTNALAAAGVTPFVAAGNGSVDPYGISFPAAAEHSVAVGNMADPSGTGPEAGWVLSLTSQRGPTLDGRIKPDIVAPGVDISAAAANSTNGYIAKGGTSMASPFTAGVAALMLDANPALAPSGVACPVGDLTIECADGVLDSSMSVPLRTLLMSSAEDWGGPGRDNEYGAGRLDAYAAIDAASPLVGTGGPRGPSHAHFSGTLAGTGSSVSHPVSTLATDYAITAAVIMKDRLAGELFPDFDVTIHDAAGQQIAASGFIEQNHRQEVASVKPATTGTYSIRVTSRSGGGAYWLDVSYPGTAAPGPPPSSDATAPSIPGSVRAVSGKGKITLTWTASTDTGGSGLAGYKIYKAAASTGPFTVAATTTSLTYNDIAVTKGKSYWYYVVAYDNAGNHSAKSVTVTGKPT